MLYYYLEIYEKFVKIMYTLIFVRIINSKNSLYIFIIYKTNIRIDILLFPTILSLLNILYKNMYNIYKNIYNI